MVNFRRSPLAGGSYFFTLNLGERRLRLLTDHIGLLRVAVWAGAAPVYVPGRHERRFIAISARRNRYERGVRPSIDARQAAEARFEEVI